jgi:calcium binding protein 39
MIFFFFFRVSSSLLFDFDLTKNCWCCSYDDAVLTLHCGNMLRELLRHDFLTRRLLFENNAALFLRFFDFVCKPNFDQASDAFDTFKCLLTKHKNLVLSFLETYYESVRLRLS